MYHMYIMVYNSALCGRRPSSEAPHKKRTKYIEYAHYERTVYMAV